MSFETEQVSDNIPDWLSIINHNQNQYNKNKRVEYINSHALLIESENERLIFDDYNKAAVFLKVALPNLYRILSIGKAYNGYTIKRYKGKINETN